MGFPIPRTPTDFHTAYPSLCLGSPLTAGASFCPPHSFLGGGVHAPWEHHSTSGALSGFLLPVYLPPHLCSGEIPKARFLICFQSERHKAVSLPSPESLPLPTDRPRGLAQQERISLQCRRCRFDPCLGKIPWRRAWQPTPVFLPRESHGERSLADYSPVGHKELDATKHTGIENAYTHRTCFQRSAP